MKILKALIVIFTLIMFSGFTYVIVEKKQNIERISAELQQIEQERQEHSYKPWYGIDQTYLSGERVDTCLCTVIDSKLYKVNVYQRTSFTYTPINK